MNHRVLHILCGGIKSGKTTFARYLQIGKKNVFRICMDEIKYSVGFGQYDDRLYKILLTSLLRMGDIVVDGTDLNLSKRRKETIKVIKQLGVDVYAYVIKRPLDECVDEYHTKEEIHASGQIQFPKLIEGFTKVMAVKWEDSAEPITYGDETMMIKPTISVVEEKQDKKPIVVKPKKKEIKRKLERGRQNLFRPKKNL